MRQEIDTTDGVKTSFRSSEPYYRMVYDAESKKILHLFYSTGTVRSTKEIFCAETYAEIAAKAAELELTDLPQKKGNEP